MKGTTAHRIQSAEIDSLFDWIPKPNSLINSLRVTDSFEDDHRFYRANLFLYRPNVSRSCVIALNPKISLGGYAVYKTLRIATEPESCYLLSTAKTFRGEDINPLFLNELFPFAKDVALHSNNELAGIITKDSNESLIIKEQEALKDWSLLRKGHLDGLYDLQVEPLRYQVESCERERREFSLRHLSDVEKNKLKMLRATQLILDKQEQEAEHKFALEVNREPEHSVRPLLTLEWFLDEPPQVVRQNSVRRIKKHAK